MDHPFDHLNGRYSPMSPPPHPFFLDHPPPPPPPPLPRRPLDPYPCPHPLRHPRRLVPEPFEFDPDWQQREQRRLMPPPPIAGVSTPERKRVRWEAHDRAFEEHHRVQGFPAPHPRRDVFFDPGRPDPSVSSPRDSYWIRLGPDREALVLNQEAQPWGPWDSWIDARPPSRGEQGFDDLRSCPASWDRGQGSSWRAMDDVARNSHRADEARHESSRGEFVPNRMEKTLWNSDAANAQRRPLPPPLFRNYENLHSHMERAPDENLGIVAGGHGFQQERLLGNKGKRRLFNGKGSKSPSKTPTKLTLRKPSALGRIQSGVSVWERIEQKPAALPLPSYHGLPAEQQSEAVQQPETDHVDLSYKSNSLVAKVLAPPNPIGTSSHEKVPVNQSPKKKVAKKKIVKPREKVVVRVALDSSGPSASEGAPMKTLGSSEKVSGEITQKSVAKAAGSSRSVASTSSYGPGPKVVKLVASGGKSAVKTASKSKASAEGKKQGGGESAHAVSSDVKPTDTSLEVCHQETAKAKPTEEPSLDICDQETAKVEPSDDHTLEICHRETAIVNPKDTPCLVVCNEDKAMDTAAERSSNIVSLVEVRGSEVMDTDENKSHGEEVPVISADSIVPDAEFPTSVSWDGKDLSSVILDGELANNFDLDVKRVLSGFSLELGTRATTAGIEGRNAKGPANTVAFDENGIKEGFSVGLAHTVLDEENSVRSDVGPTPPSDASAPPVLADGKQVSTFASSLVPFSTIDSHNREAVEQDGKGREKQLTEQCGLLAGFDVELLAKEHHSASPLPSEIENTILNASPSQVTLPSEVENTILNQTPSQVAIDDEPSKQVMDELLQSNYLCCVDISVGSEIGAEDKTMAGILPDRQDTSCSVNVDNSSSWLPDLKSFNDAKNSDNQVEKPAGMDESKLVSTRSDASEVVEHMNSNRIKPWHEISERLKTLQPQEPKKEIVSALKTEAGEEPVSKILQETSLRRVPPNRVSLAGKDAHHSTRNLRNKTWHRTDNASSPSNETSQWNGCSLTHKLSQNNSVRIQSSYIRKGNSLIRKPNMGVASQQPPHVNTTLQGVNKLLSVNSKCNEIKVDATNQVAFNTSFESTKTPLLPSNFKLTSIDANPPQDDHDKTPQAPFPEDGLAVQVGQSQSQTGDLLSVSLDKQSIPSSRTSESSDANKILYVKCKSNQLVAAPRPESGDSSGDHPLKAQKLSSFNPSDSSYYRKKKNQLIRNTLSNEHYLEVLPINSSNSDDLSKSIILPSSDGTSNISSLKCSTAGLRRRRDKVLRKTCKHSKFSLVWTLNEDSRKTGVSLVNSRKVLPSLFPWKRTLYCKNFPSNIGSISNRRSLSLISTNLQLARKRNTIYTVSTDGFSLRKAGVISIGGASLKWSKSIERRSKKANEEATLAVAEVERLKRERNRTTHLSSSKKSRSCLLRERIFRIGSARYKMDPSRKTLIRIPDEHNDRQSGENRLKLFVPKRLLIGNDEYIRVGNGNQLVRDPKKLIRILASEKVRWSLHTARLRLAKKQQYCQFFTRYGECKKNGGECPYIHDPAKVAICTKFLRGSCSGINCKLTHKVLPERMPDCSYFLRGLCTNTTCPYRHVNVSPKAEVCDGFLKGYCADGDECCKKHSYVCPTFEATGKCPEESKCKLYHPKRRSKTKKRKRATIQISSSKRRYFGSGITEVGKPLKVVSDEKNVEGEDLFCCDGRFTDYISLDAYEDDDDLEANVPIDSCSTMHESDLSDKQTDELDDLYKPVRIMNRTSTTTSITNQ